MAKKKNSDTKKKIPSEFKIENMPNLSPLSIPIKPKEPPQSKIKPIISSTSPIKKISGKPSSSGIPPVGSNQGEGKVFVKDGKNFILPKQEMKRLERQGETNKELSKFQIQREQEMKARESQVMAEKILEGQKKIGVITPPGEQERRVGKEREILKALGAGGEQALIGAGGGVVVGAVAGGGVASVPLAIGAGAVGLVGGFIRGFAKEIKEQKKDIIKGDYQNLPVVTKNINQLIRLMPNTENPDELIDVYNQQLSVISAAHSQLKLDARGKFNTEDAQVQLETYELFFQEGGMKDTLDARISVAYQKAILKSEGLVSENLNMNEEMPMEQEEQFFNEEEF